MQNPLMQTIEALAKEKGIEAETIITAIEDAVLTASRKYYKTNENLKTRFNQETGQVDLFAIKHIVSDVTNDATEISLKEAQELYGEEAEVDMEIEFPKRTDVLGRIAAQTAKQVIFQKVREAERDNVFAEYNDRVGEVINSTVKRFENGDLIVEIGRVEAVLPRKEQSRAESYTPGERIRAVIKGVNRSAKGPQILMSRTDPALLIKLFEQEVPEIYDGTVMIRGAVREAGDRAKVAVYSRERDVDPVGACVGMKGTRVQAIIRELRGEKIDIVEWSEDPVVFVTNGLSPAKVQRVSIVDDKERVMEVVVEDKQLSLAIGKKGQNVRLAAKLTGWRIDIKSEEEKRREVEAQFGALEVGEGEADGRRAPRAGRCRRDRRVSGRRRSRPSGRTSRPSRLTRITSARSVSGGESACDRRRTQFVNGSDLQSRGTARHDEPGSARAAEARSRHRAEERVEHDRGSRRALVRRACRSSAQHLAAGRRHVRRAPGAGQGRRKKAPAPKKAEPPKPTAPVLGPPRLVKTVRPAAAADAIGAGCTAASAAATGRTEPPVIEAAGGHGRAAAGARARARATGRGRSGSHRGAAAAMAPPFEEPAPIEEPSA